MGPCRKDTDKAQRLRGAYLSGQHDLVAPDWFLLEVGNVLGKAAARKTISTLEAVQAYNEILIDSPVFHPSRPLLDAAFHLALQHCRAVYDCLYLALALQEKCELITADDAFVRQLQPVYPFVVSISSLP